MLENNHENVNVLSTEQGGAKKVRMKMPTTWDTQTRRTFKKIYPAYILCPDYIAEVYFALSYAFKRSLILGGFTLVHRYLWLHVGEYL
jgi:hypothetical protein